MNTRHQAIRENFINSFVQALNCLYEICSQESSWLESAKQHAQTVAFAGVSYWAVRNISSLQTPYGKVTCNPLSCIVLCACLKAYYDYQYAEQSSRTVNFFGSKEMCQSLATQVGEKLYHRFEFSIQLMENSHAGVVKLAHFFVDAIANSLKDGVTRSDSNTENVAKLLDAALPDRGSSLYRTQCLLKKVALTHTRYLLAIPGRDNKIFNTHYSRYLSIEGLVNASPGFISLSNDKTFYIKEGTHGEMKYPPQRLEASTGFTPHPRIHFEEITYSSTAALFNNPQINQKVRDTYIPTQVADENIEVTEEDFLRKLDEIELAQKEKCEQKSLTTENSSRSFFSSLFSCSFRNNTALVLDPNMNIESSTKGSQQTVELTG